MVLTEEAFAHFCQDRHMRPVHEIGVGLDDILGRHAGLGQHGTDVLPDQLGLRFDTVRYSAVRRDTDLAGNMEQAAVQVRFHAVIVMAKGFAIPGGL